MKSLNKTLALFAMAGIFFSCSKSDQLQDIAVSEKNAVSNVNDGSCMQLRDERVVWTQVVQLSGADEVPAVMTETKGVAILRVTEDKMLYSKIIIQKLADNDNLLFAHIHNAPMGSNGPVVVTLAANADDFGVNQSMQLTDAQFDLIMNSSVYVNAHSMLYPAGIVRGQIR